MNFYAEQGYDGEEYEHYTPEDAAAAVVDESIQDNGDCFTDGWGVTICEFRPRAIDDKWLQNQADGFVESYSEGYVNEFGCSPNDDDYVRLSGANKDEMFALFKTWAARAKVYWCEPTGEKTVFSYHWARAEFPEEYAEWRNPSE